MSIKATIKVGNATNVSIEASDPVDLIKKASQFTQLPSKCGHCNSSNLQLMHRASGDRGQYDYLHLKCGDCGAQGDIGQNETPKGNIFFKFQPKDRTNVKNGFYKYWEQSGNSSSGGSGNGGGNQQSQQRHDNHPPEDDDDIPF
jgi:hypothetical protein